MAGSPEWKGHFQRALSRDGSNRPALPAPLFAAKDFVRNRTLTLNSAMLSGQSVTSLRNAPLDHASRPHTTAIRGAPQKAIVHRPWEDAVFDGKSGRWIPNDTSKNRQFQKTGSTMSMVVTEAVKDQMGPASAATAAVPMLPGRPIVVPPRTGRTQRTEGSPPKTNASRGPREEFLLSFAAANKSGGVAKSRLSRPSSAPSLRRQN